MLACTALYAIGSVIVTVAPVMGVATSKSVGFYSPKERRQVRTVRSSDLSLFIVRASPARMVALRRLLDILSRDAGDPLDHAPDCWGDPHDCELATRRAHLGSQRRWASSPFEFSCQRTVAKPDSTGELLTPALAGLVLASLVQVITVLPDSGLTTRLTVTIAIGFACLVALIVAMRRMSNPTLSLEPLRHGGLVLMLIVLILTLFANLWFTGHMTMANAGTSMGSRLLRSLSHSFRRRSSALPVLPGQDGGVQRKGVAFAGPVVAFDRALSLGVSALVRSDDPDLGEHDRIVSIFTRRRRLAQA